MLGFKVIAKIACKSSFCGLSGSYGCPEKQSLPYPITVTPAQVEDAGVSHFECPTCLAVRDIKRKENQVKFPSHPKRTTNTPNHGFRWVKGENAWRLISNEKM
jgi:hypothetical protein